MQGTPFPSVAPCALVPQHKLYEAGSTINENFGGATERQTDIAPIAPKFRKCSLVDCFKKKKKKIKDSRYYFFTDRVDMKHARVAH